jgi:hypothetical protein
MHAGLFRLSVSLNPRNTGQLLPTTADFVAKVSERGEEFLGVDICRDHTRSSVSGRSKDIVTNNINVDYTPHDFVGVPLTVQSVISMGMGLDQNHLSVIPGGCK